MTDLHSRAISAAKTAETLGAMLSQWQILDMVQMHRTGRPITYRASPSWPCQRMLDAQILAKGGHGFLHPGPRFNAVFEALKALGRIAEYQPVEVA